MPVTLECDWCGDEFTVPPSKSSRSYCSRDCYEANREDSLPLTEAELRRRYVEQGHSTYDIAADVDCDPKSVYRWLQRFDIPTRDRGDNLRGAGADHWTNLDMENPFAGREHSDRTRQKLSKAAPQSRPNLRGENNGMHGRTGEDNPNYKGGVTPERQAFYASQEWKVACRTVWERDDATCKRCGVHRSDYSDEFHVHHIVSFAVEELRSDPNNLVLLCDGCHHWVHSDENTDDEFLAE